MPTSLPNKQQKKSQRANAVQLSTKTEPPIGGTDSKLRLTVRVEINLPADAKPETYDNIFQSLRKNLIDG